MLLTPHILTGVVIITLFQNPILGLIFVLLSHYCLDLFPHTEYTIKAIRAGQWSRCVPDFLKVFADVTLGITIVFLTTGISPLILAACAVSVFPDSLTLFHCISPLNKFLKKHSKIHMAINSVYGNKKIPAFLGITNQIVVAAIAIYLLL